MKPKKSYHDYFSLKKSHHDYFTEKKHPMFFLIALTKTISCFFSKCQNHDLILVKKKTEYDFQLFSYKQDHAFVF